MITHEVLGQLLLMLAAHAFFDYAGQGDFLAQAKNPTTKIGQELWRWALPAHAVQHGAAVYVITDSIWLGVLETVVHAHTDWYKCRGRITFAQDQAMHVAYKILWCVATLMHGTSHF